MYPYLQIWCVGVEGKEKMLVYFLLSFGGDRRVPEVLIGGKYLQVCMPLSPDPIKIYTDAELTSLG